MKSNNNHIIPNIVINKILKYIVYHLYRQKISTFLKIYGFHQYRQSFKHLHLELFNYVLVSKLWKEISSVHLSNALAIENLSALRHLVGDTQSKLISPLNSVKVYNSMDQYYRDKENRERFAYKKVLVYEYASFDRILKSNEQYPNVSFSTNLQVNLMSPFIDIGSSASLQNKINHLTISNFNQGNQFHYEKVLQVIKYLQPKKIYIQCDENDGEEMLEVGVLPEFIIRNLSKFITNPNLISFGISSNYLEPHHLLDIDNSATKLKELDLRMNFMEIIKLINNGAESNSNQLFINPSNMQNDWNQMIAKLSENESIQMLSINPTTGLDPDYSNEAQEVDFNNIDTSVITQGFKLLFSNPNCSIKTLQLVQLQFTDQLFIDGLKENKSISTLIFYNEMDFSRILNQTLPINTTIRNLRFYKFTNSFFKVLHSLKNINGPVDLYSITFDFAFDMENASSFLNQLLNEIKETLASTSLSIKEFNFYFSTFELLSPSFEYQVVINNNFNNNNNTIINFKYQKENIYIQHQIH